MYWDSPGPFEYYGPVEKSILIGLCIVFICVLYYIIKNRYGYALTKRGLKRIQKSFDAAALANRPVQLKEIKFKKDRCFSLVKTILETFGDIETLKTKDHFVKQWELRSKHLENQVERTFFKRDPFLVLCVLSLLLGIMGLVYGMRVTFWGYSMIGSGGLAAISEGISDALLFPFLALINCTLAVLGYSGAKNSGKWVLAEITKLEIRLIWRCPANNALYGHQILLLRQ